MADGQTSGLAKAPDEASQRILRLFDKYEHQLRAAANKGEVGLAELDIFSLTDEITLPAEIETKLERTGLLRNIRHDAYFSDLGELWISLSDQEIGQFVETLLCASDHLRVRVCGEEVFYMKP